VEPQRDESELDDITVAERPGLERFEAVTVDEGAVGRGVSLGDCQLVLGSVDRRVPSRHGSLGVHFRQVDVRRRP
jgi:hypothetical protein